MTRGLTAFSGQEMSAGHLGLGNRKRRGLLELWAGDEVGFLGLEKVEVALRVSCGGFKPTVKFESGP